MNEAEEKAFEYLSKKYGCRFGYETIMRNPCYQVEFYAFVRGYETAGAKHKENALKMGIVSNDDDFAIPIK